MKSDEYLIVSKSVLPDYFDKVIAARELLRSGAVREVSEAVKIAGISRSTYYKYKDCVFATSEGDSCRKAVISMILHHERGVLGKVLGVLSDLGANILTITQNPPIASRATVVVSMDINALSCEISELSAVLSTIDGVESPTLVDVA